MFAVSGYRQGFIVGSFSFMGFIGGVLVGLLLRPPDRRSDRQWHSERALLAIVIAFLTATMGQLSRPRSAPRCAAG